MPTAGRLAAALAFFIVGWYVGIVAVPFFPEGNPPNWLIPLCMVIGVLTGWKVIGSRAGRGYNAAVGNGLTGAFAFSFWVMFLLAFADMIKQSLRRSYDGPMEAIVDIFNLMVEQGLDFLDPELIITVVAGGVICAVFAEFIAKRYP